MTAQLRWYDSVWLGKYFAARDVIARVAPGRLAEFCESFAPLRTDPACAVKELPGLFDPPMLAAIAKTVAAIPKEKLELHELKRFGRFIVHDHPPFTELQHTLVQRVSEWAGEPVEPSYNFLSLYTKLGVCEPHLDAPSAKWTLDICIGQSEPWPIQFSQILPWPEAPLELGDDWRAEIKARPDLQYQSKTLQPGDAILFSGSSQWHYRDAIPRGKGKQFCDLLFFHFIPAGTAELVRPGNWARLFAIPELAEIPGIDDAR
jgi:hypothetical protein